MKRDLLLTLGMTVALMAGAAEISPEQALRRAMDAAARDVSTKSLTLNRKPGQAHKLSYVMNYTQNPAQAAVYVFSAPGDKGYLVSPVDDRFPALLGYSDTGRIDSDNIPPQMQWWLSEYAREMDYAIQHGLADGNGRQNVAAFGNSIKNTRVMAPREPIVPLLQTKYNQSKPYNDDCPMIYDTYGNELGRAVTGCVATAMAQVMRYWNYPATGRGSHSYKVTPPDAQEFTESMDFSKTTFDWTNMLPQYISGEYNSKQAKAVAVLMHACGVSVEMKYTQNESGAPSRNVVTALNEYFKYDPSISYATRNMFNNSEWEQLIYNEVAQSRPVQVDGYGSRGGHAFVCDGFEGDHYFHFNWGWGGMSDGYFLFCALNPGSLGIGGGAGGFNYDQDVIFNIFPEGQGTPQVLPASEASVVCNGNLTYGIYPESEDDIKVFYPANDNGFAAFYNAGVRNFAGTIGMIFEETGSTLQYPAVFGDFPEDEPLPAGYGFSYIYVEVPEDMPNGEYKVYPAYLKAGASDWDIMNAPNGFTNYLYLTIIDGTITTVKKPEIDTSTLPDLMAPYFSVKGNAIQNTPVLCNMSFLNVSDLDYDGVLRMMACDSKGNETEIMTIPQSLPAQVCVPSSGNLTLSLAAGDYDIYFKDDYNRKLTGTYHITVTEGTSGDFNPDFQMTGMSPVEFEPSEQAQYFEFYWKRNPRVDSNTSFKFSCKLTDAQGNVKFESESGSGRLPTTDTYRAGVSNFIPNFGTGTYTMSVKAQSAVGGTDVFGKEYDACKPFPVVIRSIVETLSVNESCTVPMGKTKSIKYTVTPASAATELMWTSLNPDVVTVDANGKVTGISEGTAKVIGCSPNGHFGICEVTVLNASEPDPDPDPDPSSIDTPVNDGIIRAVYTTQGIRVLKDASAKDMNSLPGGIYIIVTDKGTYKTTLNR